MGGLTTLSWDNLWQRWNLTTLSEEAACHQGCKEIGPNHRRSEETPSLPPWNRRPSVISLLPPSRNQFPVFCTWSLFSYGVGATLLSLHSSDLLLLLGLILPEMEPEEEDLASDWPENCVALGRTAERKEQIQIQSQLEVLRGGSYKSWNKIPDEDKLFGLAMCNSPTQKLTLRDEHRFPVSEDISLVGFAQLDNEIDSITCTLDNTSGIFPANEVPSKYIRPVNFCSISQNKRPPYSECSQEEKDQKKSKWGETALKKKQAKEELVPVLVQQHEGSEKFPAFKIHEKVESDQHGINVSFSNIGLVANVVSMGKHVYIHGVVSGTLMPLPKFDMRTMPCKACVCQKYLHAIFAWQKDFLMNLWASAARWMYLCIQWLFLISYKNCSWIQLQNLHILGSLLRHLTMLLLTRR